MSEVRNNLSIRPASQSDLPAILRLWTQLMDFHSRRDPWFEMCEGGCDGYADHVKHCMADERAIILVAEASGVVVGYCLGETVQRPPVFREPGFGAICDLAVDEDFRRSGVGGELVSEMLRLLREKGAGRIEVSVAVCNEVSTAFWRKMGFVPYMERLCLQH